MPGSNYLKNATITLILILIYSQNYSQQSNQLYHYYYDSNQKPKTAYLLHNHKPLDFDEDTISPFYVIDSSQLTQSKIFLLGYEYGVNSVHDISLELLKFLYENSNVRHLLVDASYSVGLMLNQYLSSGDLKLLRKALWNRRFMFTKQDYQFYQELYEYNSSLNDSNKIDVTGISFEGGYEADIIALNNIIRQKSIPGDVYSLVSYIYNLNGSVKYDLESDSLEINRLISDLKKNPSRKYLDAFYKHTHDDAPKDAIETFIDDLINDMQFQPDVYKRFLDADFFEFWMIVRNMKTKLDGKESGDKVMTVNLLNLCPKLKNGNFYGHFHRKNIQLKNTRFFHKSFAKNINKNMRSIFKNKTVTIGSYYEKSKSSYSSKLISERKFKKFNACPHSTATLYKIVSEDSPFKKRNQKYHYVLLSEKKLALNWLSTRYW